jgi:serine phosphatase RsbU (regulator of sigma subunit)/HAMP domain-containing protein
MRRLVSRLVGRLSVAGKLATIYLLDLLVTASILVSFINAKANQIDFSQKESKGAAIYKPARALYEALIQDARAPRGAPESPALAHNLALTDEARQRYGGEMSLDKDWKTLKEAAKEYDAARSSSGRETAFRAYQDRLHGFLATVGDNSNLILDTDLDSYYAMVIAVDHMRHLVQTIEEYSYVALHDPATEVREMRLSALEADIRQTEARIRRGIEIGIGATHHRGFEPALQPPFERLEKALDTLIATVREGGDVAVSADKAQGAAFSFWKSTLDELSQLLTIRVNLFYHQTELKLGLILALALVVLCAVTYIGLQITRAVRELVTVAESFRSGDPRRAVWDSNDEFGTLVNAFNGMLDRLAEESQRRSDAAAAASAAEAQRQLLEAVALPIVVTSLSGGQLLHANPAARLLMGDQPAPGRRGLDFLLGSIESQVVKRLAVTGALDEVELEVTGSDGAKGAMVLSARRIDYRDEEAALFSLTPVNELKRVQGELREAKELAEINAEQLRATTDMLLSSISYASRIQHSIFPDESAISRLVNRLEIWIEQRDIVGGDWYWVGRFPEGDLVFLCDCTGHGVPGALMTMLVSACFERAIEEQDHRSPGAILGALHRLVRRALSRNTAEMAADDGLDAACIFLGQAAATARIASARLTVLHADKEGMHEIKGDRTSLGYPSLPESVTLTERCVPMAPGDFFYLFTDGCTDQMGTERRILFGRKRMIDAIDALRHRPPEEQIASLRVKLAAYRRDEPTRDDATLIVLRVADRQTATC